MTGRRKRGGSVPTGLILAMLFVLAPGLAGAERSAQANYLIHCAGCHRIDGRGFETEVPDLTAELGAMLQVPGGREYLVQVPGASQAPISDAELAGVINLVIARFAPEALARGVAPFDAAEVTRHRARRPLNIFDERQRLLALIAALPDE